jgi:uncharacterized membrane protein YgaE (UPF0421/DUF939 family)
LKSSWWKNIIWWRLGLVLSFLIFGTTAIVWLIIHGFTKWIIGLSFTFIIMYLLLVNMNEPTEAENGKK